MSKLYLVLHISDSDLGQSGQGGHGAGGGGGGQGGHGAGGGGHGAGMGGQGFGAGGGALRLHLCRYMVVSLPSKGFTSYADVHHSPLAGSDSNPAEQLLLVLSRVCTDKQQSPLKESEHS